jgi:hypothetical protein
MKRRLCAGSAMILTIFLLHGSALAGGWGPYFSWGREEPSTGLPDFLIDQARQAGLPDDVIQALEAANIDVSLDHLSFGVMYESAPAQDRLFSYRGTLGFDIATSLSIENVEIAGISAPLAFGIDLDQSSKYGLSTNHTFAFGLVRTSRLKWWVGPGIGLTFNYYQPDLPAGLHMDAEAGNLSIGGGGETGVNIHLGSTVTLCVGGGVHWRAFAYGGGTDVFGSMVWGNGPLYFIQTSLLFRTGADRI